MTLAEFLLARLAEDEAFAREAMRMPERVHPRDGEVVQSSGPPFRGPGYWGCDGANHVHASDMWDYDEPIGYRMDVATIPPDLDVARHIATWDPARVLAECEAKRWIVETCEEGCECGASGTTLGNWAWPWYILGALALPYAEHPEYQAEWAVTESVGRG